MQIKKILNVTTKICFYIHYCHMNTSIPVCKFEAFLKLKYVNILVLYMIFTLKIA